MRVGTVGKRKKRTSQRFTISGIEILKRWDQHLTNKSVLLKMIVRKACNISILIIIIIIIVSISGVLIRKPGAT